MSIRSRTPSRRPPHDSRPPDAHDVWYRQSVVWLGAIVLAASIGGCIWLIVVAERYADPPLPVDGLQILKVPLTRPPPQTPGPSP